MFLLPAKHHPSWLLVGYNLVPGAFPLGNMVGPSHFLRREKDWGRGCVGCGGFSCQFAGILVCCWKRNLKVSPDLSLEGNVLAWGGILRCRLQADKTSYFGRRSMLDRNRKPRMKVSGSQGNLILCSHANEISVHNKGSALGIVSKVKLPICITVEPCLTQFIQRFSFIRRRQNVKEAGHMCLAMSPGESDRQKHSPLLLSHLAGGQKTVEVRKCAGSSFVWLTALSLSVILKCWLRPYWFVIGAWRWLRAQAPASLRFGADLRTIWPQKVHSVSPPDKSLFSRINC